MKQKMEYRGMLIKIFIEMFSSKLKVAVLPPGGSMKSNVGIVYVREIINTFAMTSLLGSSYYDSNLCIKIIIQLFIIIISGTTTTVNCN